ncbi:uncharacterized protein KY384_003607 [Bacidia gigantensis]|uniref:uncharacterized protein n=1 Tax=Bacidia gigantensis TaxID=2732470 RepID=UPI001D049246|nr:uncharacterized protein KY384_003607 [Bacidia gigantensis]KAG8531971.1 hypothetical protein KY384_003607 [Bacidia gigantensis]
MDFSAPASEDLAEPDAIIVRADEVDEAGADISTISPTETSSESDFNARIENRRAQDAQPTGSPKILANAVPSPTRPLPRPILRREGSVPLPPKQPPPPAPNRQDPDEKPADSLSLQQLKKLMGDLPKLEPAAYAYEYEETRGLEEEVQEWFIYTEEERLILLKEKEVFEDRWHEWVADDFEIEQANPSWIDVGDSERMQFVKIVVEDLESDDVASRVKSLGCLSYIALGAWDETKRVQLVNPPRRVSQNNEDSATVPRPTSEIQMDWIFQGTAMLSQQDIIQRLISSLEALWHSELEAGPRPEMSEAAYAEMRMMRQLECNHVLTTLYLIIETGRCTEELSAQAKRRDAFANVKPGMLFLLTRMIATTRWEDSVEASCISRHKLLLLLWKSFLFLLGQNKDVKDCKRVLREESHELQDVHDEKFITASPLDYHLFRQEITSKYPAYSPPPPLVPIEPDNNTILPPLPNHPSRQASQDNLNAYSGNTTSGSIFNQPVHIATPAPSPPPSPAGPGGKGGKKQNYQTNQNFPFLYPPLDETSNTLGGKGSVETQDKLVGRRWHGSDVPASILEAGQLFASRMRMSRSLRQLWDARERYIKEERGWGNPDAPQVSNHKIEKFDHEPFFDSTDEHHEEGDLQEDHHSPMRNSATVNDESNINADEVRNDGVRKRLNAVNDYYTSALPDLQSLVLVLVMKELLNSVSDLHAGTGLPSHNNSAEDAGDNSDKRKTNPNSSANLNALINEHGLEREEDVDPTVETLNDVRMREISTKAVSGILLILLKWFKISHVLKFEYLTQLLLDASYLPLVLKYFGFQDVDKAVEQKNDREDLDFFAFCHHHSKHPPASPPQPALSPSDSDSDDAAPPPIRKHRRSPTSQSPSASPPPSINSRRPEVDELGFPTAGSTIPQTPLTNYAPRFFLTNINLLRILQKITKRKAHRALLLVQCKSSTILRKSLKIPQPDLRLYTLKLFKSQVPYCGRKWRQTNMRVITAIYLHCRPELRDEWLCGGDVDGVVEEAVPVEQAGRSLVHWWHLRAFREMMEGKSAGKDADEGQEYDFFARELEKMGWDFEAVEEEQGVEGPGDVNGPGGGEVDGGLMRAEGGTGCISLLLHAILASRGVSSQVIGVDAAPLAVKLARRNLQHNHGNGLLTQDAHDDIAFLNADIFEDDFMTKTEEYYDVLVSNPPYISLQAFATTTSRSVRNFEPRAALVPSRQSSTTAHQDGGDIFYPRLLSIAHEIQAKILLVEVADLEQAKRVAGLVVENPRWHGCEIWRDWPAQSSHANVHEVVIRGRTLNLRGDGNGRAVFAWTQDGQDLLKTRR